MSGPREWSDPPREEAGGHYGQGLSGFYDQHGDAEDYHDGDYHDGDFRDGDFHDHEEPDGGYDEGHYQDHYDDHDDTGWPVVADRAGASPAPPSRRTHGRGGRERRGRHRILKALAAIVVIIVLLAGGTLLWAQSQINPGGHRGALVSVVIPKGSSTKTIGSRLAAAGVIHNGSLFALYVRLHGYGPLYPGTYQMQRNEPYSAAIAALRAGPKILTDTLLIPEGYTVAQIADAVGKLPGLGLSAQKFLAAATSGTVRSPYEPSGVNNLEGLLFPATYPVRQGETEVDLLEQMIGTFDDQVQSLGLTTAASHLGLTPYQVITVASIVEREAKLASDRPNVASAIYNRIRIGMKLGADSTQTYYLRLSNPTIQPTAAQLDQPSPYNTRTNTGLPPTPIADPGLASLQAAANPATTSYLYFVEINPDGQLGFASTNAGFDRLQQQCRAAALC